MKNASLFLIFLSFFSLSAIAGGLDAYAPEKHISFEQQGKYVDNFLSRTFARLSTSFENIGTYYNLSKSDSVRRVKEVSGKIKDAAANTIKSGINEAHERLWKK